MTKMASVMSGEVGYPARIRIDPAVVRRNRLTTAFRLVLAIPHLVIVGGPAAVAFSWEWQSHARSGLGAGGGVLGAVAAIAAIIAWFAIVLTGRHPSGLWQLSAYYLRWRVRAVAYTALLRDEYPPFGDAPYPAALELDEPGTERDRLGVAFRLVLAIPQLIAVWLLGIAWAITTVVAWFAILLTGRYPRGLYRFGVGVLVWSTRVEAYVLLLRDEYPPFSLEPALGGLSAPPADDGGA